MLFKLSEATAARRRVYFHLVDATDGITAETGEATGQPQFSINGAGFNNTTNTLVSIGSGGYYVEMDVSELATLGAFMVRYKSANTAEFQDAHQVVGYDPFVAADQALIDFFTSKASLVDDIWDEVLTGATHNVSSSSGRRLRELGAFAMHTGTAQGGSGNSITLAAGASADNDLYAGEVVAIIDGPGAGQARTIVQYNGTSKLAHVQRNWEVDPTASSEYSILAGTTPIRVHDGLAQAGAAGSITLAASASATDAIYVGLKIVIQSGTGEDQSRLISAYNGTSKVASVAPNWTVTPDTTSVYVVYPTGKVKVEAVTDGAIGAAAFASGALDAVWSTATRLLTAGTNIVLAKGVGLTGLNDVSAAQVNAEVVDALNVDTYAEIGQETPAATQTLRKMVAYLYKAFRNRSTQTATQYSLLNDDAVTVDQKATFTDNGTTADRGEMTGGP